MNRKSGSCRPAIDVPMRDREIDAEDSLSDGDTDDDSIPIGAINVPLDATVTMPSITVTSSTTVTATVTASTSLLQTKSGGSKKPRTEKEVC